MQKTVSIFSQILAIVNKTSFMKRVNEYRGDRGSKGFTCWDQFVSMLFCQLAQAKSLNEICMGLKACLGKISHLGMNKAPGKSTLAYANAHRPWEIYQGFFEDLYKQLRAFAPKNRFRFKNKLYSLDSTIIDLCAKVFSWASFQRTKGAVKLHLLLDHDGFLPAFAHITKGKVHDINIAHTLKLPKGSLIVMDRGYFDFKLFARWIGQSVDFVTRLKKTAQYEILENNNDKISEKAQETVANDLVIVFSSAYGQKTCPHRLRLVEVWCDEQEKFIELITNRFDLDAETIAELYRERWQIEIFFKLLKQNLKVKTFVGTSEKALHTQIWTALIAMLLLAFLKFRSRLGWAFSNLVALVRWNLFVHKDLWKFIDDPFNLPSHSPGNDQLTLCL